jgi:hypothetical protein
MGVLGAIYSVIVALFSMMGLPGCEPSQGLTHCLVAALVQPARHFLSLFQEL